jgi:selenocysteine lyase/cysteine desulfurase
VTKFRANAFRKAIKGSNLKVPVLGKRWGKYTNFDNAASTPPLIPVLRSLEEYLDWYSGVHRGTGYKSLISSKIYDECHHIIANFVQARNQ